MHAIKVNAAVMRRLRARDHTVVGLPALPIETLRDAEGCTHILCDAPSIAAVLGDDAFVPSDIGGAVASVGASFGIDVSALMTFLRETPLLACGPDHQAKRRRFMQHHNQMRQRHSAFIRSTAERHFEELASHPAGGLSDRWVVPYVDAVLRHVFDGEVATGGALYDRLSRCPNTVLELLHHPRLLGETSNAASEFLAGLDLSNDGSGAAEDRAAPCVLLAYVLMGRGPLIGALSALVHDVALTHGTDARQAQLLAEISPTQVFQRASPVNFIGRTATAARDIDGVSMHPGDRILLMLPYANAGTSRASAAFGQGSHTCAGTALSLEIADAFLSAWRRCADRLNPNPAFAQNAAPGVFRQYT